MGLYVFVTDDKFGKNGWSFFGLCLSICFFDTFLD